MNTRNRTPSEYIGYGLYLYFSGLSLRRASERLSSCFVKRNHVSIWNWIQKYKPKKLSNKRKRIEEYIIDETIIKVGSDYIWLWIAVEPEDREILFLFPGCGIYMYLPRYFLFKTPFSNNAVNVIMVIPYSTFLYYYLLDLFCSPACVALLQNSFYPVFYLSGYLWMSTTPYLVLQSF